VLLAIGFLCNFAMTPLHERHHAKLSEVEALA